MLFLIDQLRAMGGAERALLRTVRTLPAERFRCTVATFRLEPQLPWLAEFPCPVQLLPMRRTYGWRAAQMAVRLVRYIHRERVDIVHTQFPSSDLWGGMVAKLSRRPLLVSSRRDMGILRSSWHGRAYRALHGMFDCVLTVSEAVRQQTMVQDGVPSARIRTLYNAVESLPGAPCGDEATQLRARFGIPARAPLVVSVGNLRRVKGFDVLIRAAAVVCRELPEAHFLIAGGESEPECRRELEELIAALGLASRVHFAGPVEDATPLLRAADLFCLLSRSEGFSNALLEAMACGVPSVATRVGGNAEALEAAACGLLVESEDARGAAAAMLRLLRDRPAAEAMGARAREEVSRRFSPEAATAKLAAIYEELLAGRTAGEH